MTITVSSKEFQTFISAIANINREGVSIVVYKDYMEALLISEDFSSIIMYAKVNILNPEATGLDDGEDKKLNIKDLSKFQKLLDINNEDTFTFSLKKNYIHYKGSIVKNAKFMLAENPPKAINKRITVDWFHKFEKSFNCEVPKQTIKQIIQMSAFTGLAESKAYFTTKNDEFVVELNDKTKDNIDNISISLSTDYTGTVGEVIIATDTLTKILLSSENITIESSVITRGNITAEVLFFTIAYDNVYLKYMLNSKKS